jgi:hypothetical protein
MRTAHPKTGGSHRAMLRADQEGRTCGLRGLGACHVAPTNNDPTSPLRRSLSAGKAMSSI